jgi:hypothetical protein
LATITVYLPISSSGAYADWMPLKTLRGVASPMSSVRRSSLSEPSTRAASTIFAMRRSIFAKSPIAIVSAMASPPGSSASSSVGSGGCRGSVEQRVHQLRIDALHQVPVLADRMRAQGAARVGEHERGHAQEGLDLRREGRQHRLQVDRQQPERLDADRADLVQPRRPGRPAGQLPGLVLVDDSLTRSAAA